MGAPGGNGGGGSADGLERIDIHSVAFDIDGVIADTMGLFIDIARDEYRIPDIRYEDITCYQLEACLSIADRSVIPRILQRIMDGDYSADLQPLDGAIRVLTRLIEISGALTLVSARPYEGPIGDWIRGILPMPDGVVDIVTTGSHEAKADVLSSRNVRFFVEDRLETCFALSAAGITPILFRQPWNRRQHPFLEVGSWDELEQMVAFPPMPPDILADNETHHPNLC